MSVSSSSLKGGDESGSSSCRWSFMPLTSLRARRWRSFCSFRRVDEFDADDTPEGDNIVSRRCTREFPRGITNHCRPQSNDYQLWMMDIIPHASAHAKTER